MNRIFTLLMLVAGAAVAGGIYLDQPRLYPLAAVAFGLFGVIGGIKAIAGGQLVMGRQNIVNPDKVERYAGITARMIGVVLLVGGLGIVVIGAIYLASPDGAASLEDSVLRSPRALGAILGVAGLLVTLMGMVRAKAGSGTRNEAYGSTVEAEIKGGGMITTVVGIAMIALALSMIIAPGAFQGFLDDLSNK